VGLPVAPGLVDDGPAAERIKNGLAGPLGAVGVLLACIICAAKIGVARGCAGVGGDRHQYVR